MPEATFRLTVRLDPDDTMSASKATDTTVDIDTTLISGEVIKSEPEQRFTLCVGYPARKPDKGVAQDGFRDWAGERACELAAWNYLKSSPKVGLWHSPGNSTEGVAEVVESYIYRRDDPWVLTASDGTTQTVCKGDWLIGLVWSEAGWQKIKSGDITGVSAQGRAKRRHTDPADLATLRS